MAPLVVVPDLASRPIQVMRRLQQCTNDGGVDYTLESESASQPHSDIAWHERFLEASRRLAGRLFFMHPVFREIKAMTQQILGSIFLVDTSHIRPNDDVSIDVLRFSAEISAQAASQEAIVMQKWYPLVIDSYLKHQQSTSRNLIPKGGAALEEFHHALEGLLSNILKRYLAETCTHHCRHVLQQHDFGCARYSSVAASPLGRQMPLIKVSLVAATNDEQDKLRFAPSYDEFLNLIKLPITNAQRSLHV